MDFLIKQAKDQKDQVQKAEETGKTKILTVKDQVNESGNQTDLRDEINGEKLKHDVKKSLFYNLVEERIVETSSKQYMQQFTDISNKISTVLQQKTSELKTIAFLWGMPIFHKIVTEVKEKAIMADDKAREIAEQTAQSTKEAVEAVQNRAAEVSTEVQSLATNYVTEVKVVAAAALDTAREVKDAALEKVAGVHQNTTSIGAAAKEWASDLASNYAAEVKGAASYAQQATQGVAGTALEKVEQVKTLVEAVGLSTGILATPRDDNMLAVPDDRNARPSKASHDYTISAEQSYRSLQPGGSKKASVSVIEIAQEEADEIVQSLKDGSVDSKDKI